jgi:hypothetical protein
MYYSSWKTFEIGFVFQQHFWPSQEWLYFVSFVPVEYWLSGCLASSDVLQLMDDFKLAPLWSGWCPCPTLLCILDPFFDTSMYTLYWVVERFWIRLSSSFSVMKRSRSSCTNHSDSFFFWSVAPLLRFCCWREAEGSWGDSSLLFLCFFSVVRIGEVGKKGGRVWYSGHRSPSWSFHLDDDVIPFRLFDLDVMLSLCSSLLLLLLSRSCRYDQ